LEKVRLRFHNKIVSTQSRSSPVSKKKKFLFEEALYPPTVFNEKTVKTRNWILNKATDEKPVINLFNIGQDGYTSLHPTKDIDIYL